MRAGFEGGQMPIYMRIGKSRGNTSKDAMPVGPFRTYTQPVNVAALDRFDAGTEVTPELLKQAGLIQLDPQGREDPRPRRADEKLTVSAHAVSATAREKIEAAGGTVTLLREPKVEEAARRRSAKPKPAPQSRSRQSRRDRRGGRGGVAPCSPGSPTPGGFPSSAGASSSPR